MTGRLSSGHDRLDAILEGGIPDNAISLLIGAPGSGKTILAQQYLFQNATVERPCVYFSTVSEPFDKILRYGQNLTFFDVSALGSRVFYEDLGAAVTTDGLAGALSRIEVVLRERRPGMVVIDSFKALYPFASDEGHFRRFLHELAARMSAMATSSIWVGEYETDQVSQAAEFAVADAIIALTVKQTDARETRVLRVIKLRGSGFAGGEHTYRIRASGLDIFPRLADAVDAAPYQLGLGRDTTGVAALDELLGDGYWPGSSTLLAGPTGIGKTLLGLHFLFGGAAVGQPGLLATLQENATQMGRIASSFGWAFEKGGVTVMSSSPVDMYIDEWVYELLDRVERDGVRRVVVDSMGDLLTASEPRGFREWMYSLLQRCTRQGVSLMLTLEVPELFQLTRLADDAISHLSDNVVLLQYERGQSELLRTVTVLKTRASEHRALIRHFDITSAGITLDDGVLPSPEQPAAV